MNDVMNAVISKALSLVGLGYIYGAQGQICSLKFRQQQAAQYPKQAENILGIGAKWDGRPVWECAQLTQEVAAEGGVKLVSGATSQWTKTDWAETGTIDTIPENDVVFVYKRSKSNSDVMSHTGVYLGDGTVVDARGVEDGVLHESLSDYPWTHWARPAWGEAVNDTPPTLRKGSEGPHVKELQKALLLHGYDLPKYGADGKFGAETEKAVRVFQRNMGLVEDGVVGRKTWAALGSAKAAQAKYSLTITNLTLDTAEKIAAQYGGEIQVM